MLCTLRRVDWHVVSATELVAHDGRRFDLRTDPPIVVARHMDEGVRACKWKNMARVHPPLPSIGANIAPIYKLLNKKLDGDWTVEMA